MTANDRLMGVSESLGQSLAEIWRIIITILWLNGVRLTQV